MADEERRAHLSGFFACETCKYEGVFSFCTYKALQKARQEGSSTPIVNNSIPLWNVIEVGAD